MMQIQKVEQCIHDYISEAACDPTEKDIISYFDGKIAQEIVKQILNVLRVKDIIVLHEDGTYTLNNPGFDPSKHDWVIID